MKRHFEEQQRKALEEQKNERERLRLLQLEEEAKAKAKAEKERQDKADADKKMQDMLAEQQRATAMQAQMQAQMQAKMQVRVCLFMREKKVEYCCNGKYTMTVKSQFNLHCLYGWLQQQMHGCMNEWFRECRMDGSGVADWVLQWILWLEKFPARDEALKTPLVLQADMMKQMMMMQQQMQQVGLWECSCFRASSLPMLVYVVLSG